MKKAAGFFIFLGLFILAVIFSLSLALNTKDARQILLNRVNAMIPGTLSMDHLSVSLLAGSLEAVNLNLAGPDNDNLIYIKRLSFNLSWVSLLFRSVSLDEVVVDEPRIFLAMDENRSLNVVRALVETGQNTDTATATSGDADSHFNIKLDFLDLKDGLVSFSLSGEETVLAENLRLKVADVNLTHRSGVLGLSFGPCRVRFGERDVTIDHLDVAGEIDDSRLSSLLVDMVSLKSHLTLTGEVDHVFTHPKADLTLDLVHNNLEHIDHVFELGLGLGGEARIQGRIQGDYDNPDVAVTINASRVHILDRTFPLLSLKASMKNRVATLDSLDLESDLGKAKATGTFNMKHALDPSDLFSAFHSDNVTYSVDLNAHVPLLEKIPYVEGIAAGPATARIKARGKGLTWDQMAVEADVTAGSSALSFIGAPLSAYALDGKVALKDHALSIEGAHLENGKTRVDVTGEYRFDSWTYEGDLNLSSDDLSGFALIQPYGDYAGHLDVKTHWFDTGDMWKGSLSGNGQEISVNGIRLGELVTEAGLDNTGVLTVVQCDAGYSDFSINGSGSLGVFGGDNRLNLTVDLIQADIANALKIEGAKALVDGHVALTGTWDDPRLDAMLTATGLAWEDLSLGQLTTAATYDKGRISLSDTTLNNKTSTIIGHGSALILDPKSFALRTDPIWDIQLISQDVFVQDFYGGVSGHVSLDTYLKGKGKHLSGRITARGEALDVMGQKIPRVDVESRIDNDELLVDRALISMAEDEDIRISGRLSLADMAYEVTADSDGIALTRFFQLESQTLCRGKVAVQMSGKGTLDNPGLDGTVMLRDITVNGQPLDGGTVTVNVADNSVRLGGILIAPVAASINLDTYDFDARVDFDRSELAPFFRIGGYDELTGDITGVVKARGRVTEPETIRADMNISSLRARAGSLDVIKGGTILVTYEEGIVQCTGTRLTLPRQGELVVNGKGKIDGDVSFELDGTIPLGILNHVTEDLTDISGMVRVSATLTGTAEEPDLKGDLAIDDVSFLIPEFVQRVHGVSGRIHAEPGRVTLENLSGGLDRGRFEIRGSLELDHLEPGPVNLTITGESLPFSVPDVMDMTVNTSMTFSGTPSKTRLEGTVMLIEGRYYRDVSMNLISMVSEKTRKVTVEKQPIQAPYLENMVLDVSLRHRNSFDVDNNIAYLELMPDLKLYGTLNQPLITGRAQVGDGVITYQGKEFEVTKGVVDFLNPYKVEPTLDVVCETELREWVITLSISGTPDNLNFELTSNPSESDGDILYLLLFGKTTRELRESRGGAPSISAAQLLSDAISRNLERNIKDATGMDIVKVEYSNTNSESSEGGISVSIGKELSDRLTLIYEVESKDAETVQKAISEYKFLESLLINAYQDTGNDYGAELVYRLEFRRLWEP